MGSFFVHSFGCRASAADGDGLARQLIQAGHAPASSLETAALVVINTCAVTSAAERSARALVRRTLRRNSEARVLVTGCYAQRAPGEIAALPGVAAVVGNSHKPTLVQIAFGPDRLPTNRGMPSGPVILHAPYAGEHGAETFLPGTLPPVLPGALTGSATRTRPVLRVQDGCGNRCSFCVIPETRGPSRSVEPSEILQAAGELAAHGVQEAVLSGINLGRWGADLRPRQTLASLVRRLLESSGLPRLRLSSIEPMDWSPELLALLEEFAGGPDPKLANHAHLPLQSGADRILRRMHRRYRPWHYAGKLQAIAERMPEAALGADVMVGFPGETDAMFQESYDFIRELPLTYLHLFPFSPRPRTAGEEMNREDPVSAQAVAERMEALADLAREKSRLFRERFLGRTLSGVTLAGGSALTSNYLNVSLGSSHLPNQHVQVQIASIQGDLLEGTIAPASDRN